MQSPRPADYERERLLKFPTLDASLVLIFLATG